MKNLTIAACLMLFSISAVAQKSSIKLGAYYFDGWTGTYPYHITPKLVDSFPEREPIWGWKTSTQRNVDSQIKTASAAGLSFFNFCWYYKNKDAYKSEPLNRALDYYLKSPYKSRLKYCITMINDSGFDVQPADWPYITAELVSQFSSGTYLKVDGKPLFVIYSLKKLVQKFNGASELVKQAFDSLRIEAKRKGFAGVTIACCAKPEPESTQLAEACGADLLTAYNFQYAGFDGKHKVIHIDSLQVNEQRLWSRFKKVSALKFMPVVTLNWDTRPWSQTNNFYATTPRYTGYSAITVFKSISNLKRWLNTHTKETTHEKFALVYAWNEYGEGAWLTPGKRSKFNYLSALTKALQK